MVAQGWLTPADRAPAGVPGQLDARRRRSRAACPDDDRYHIYNAARAELERQGHHRAGDQHRGPERHHDDRPEAQERGGQAVKKVMRRPAGQPALGAGRRWTRGPARSWPTTAARTASALDYAERAAPARLVVQAVRAGRRAAGAARADRARQRPTTARPGRRSPARRSTNSEGVELRPVHVKTAMTKSINTVFYQMAVDVGPQKVVDAAHQAGIPQDLLPEPRGGIALGDQEVHPIDMASAYATFAADGHAPRAVHGPEGRRGRRAGAVRPAPSDTGQGTRRCRRRSPATSPSRCSTWRAQLRTSSCRRPPGRGRRPAPCRARDTGQNKDAWTVGYTPSLSTAVWVGTDDSDPIKNSTGQADLRPDAARVDLAGVHERRAARARRRRAVLRLPGRSATAPSATRRGDDEDSDDQRADGDDPRTTGTRTTTTTATTTTTEQDQNQNDGNGDQGGNPVDGDRPVRGWSRPGRPERWPGRRDTAPAARPGTTAAASGRTRSADRTDPARSPSRARRAPGSSRPGPSRWPRRPAGWSAARSAGTRSSGAAPSGRRCGWCC